MNESLWIRTASFCVERRKQSAVVEEKMHLVVWDGRGVAAAAIDHPRGSNSIEWFTICNYPRPNSSAVSLYHVPLRSYVPSKLSINTYAIAASTSRMHKMGHRRYKMANRTTWMELLPPSVSVSRHHCWVVGTCTWTPLTCHTAPKVKKSTSQMSKSCAHWKKSEVAKNSPRDATQNILLFGDNVVHYFVVVDINRHNLTKRQKNRSLIFRQKK